MIGFRDSKLAGAPPPLSWVVRPPQKTLRFGSERTPAGEAPLRPAEGIAAVAPGGSEPRRCGACVRLAEAS